MPGIWAALARIVTGRRSKWLVVLVWVVLIVPFGALGSKLADATDNRTESFLPADAESTEALRVQEQRFPGGETRQRADRLPARRRADGRRPRRDRRRRRARRPRELPLAAPPVIPFADGAPPELVSPAGDLAYTIVTVPDDNDRIAEWGTRPARGRPRGHARGARGLRHRRPRLQRRLRGGLRRPRRQGPAGHRRARASCCSLVIYRSPVIALIPLVVVGIAYTIARGLVYLYAESGADGLRQRRDDPRGADVRGGDRLLPAAGRRATARSCAATRTSTTRWSSRSGAPGRRSWPAG